MKTFLIVLILSGFCASGLPAEEPAATNRTVRVAAAQCYSRMGQVDYNRDLLTKLAREAAKGGAKIIVFPECAVSGYMDPGNHVVWSAKPGTDAGELGVNKVAETVPGPSTEHFGKLARELDVYLCLPLIEKEESLLYNSQVLLDPAGKIVAHHRKKNLWTPGDGLWASQGDRALQVVETPYGNIGLMICFDFHMLPAHLKQKKADIVLYSVGWYAPNPENWFKNVFPMKSVVPNGFSIVVANWSAEKKNPGWPGHGCSCVIDHTGKVLSMAKSDRDSEIVFADLPVRAKPEAKP